MNIGENIRKIRLSKNLTIKDITDKIDITKSLLSQVENNKANPSLKTLAAIAEALNVPIGTFFDSNDEEVNPVVRASERKTLKTKDGVQFNLLTPQYKNHQVEFFYNVYEQGASTGEYYSHHGEECGFVLKGKFKIECDQNEYTLEEGDSIIIDSTKPHRITNIHDGESIAIWVDTPASW